MNGGELLAACLAAQGVEWISALCGNGLNELLAGCRTVGIRVIDTRNEQCAAYMAESWGRLSGRVGVCAVSSGVAHVNALTGVANAFFDGAPMLLISGAGPLASTGRGHFQDLDQVALAAPLCKLSARVDSVARLPERVQAAFVAALGGRPGPVYLTVPMDVLAADADAVSPGAAVARPRGGRPAEEDVARLTEMLANCRRPLVIAGSGVYYGGGEQALVDFCADFAVPVQVPIWGRGCVPSGFDPFVGVVGAATGEPPLLAEADLLLLLGAEIDYRVGYLDSPPLAAGARVVQVDVDAARLRARSEGALLLQSDPGALVGRLHEMCLARQLQGFEEWLARARASRDEYRSRVLAGARRQDGRLHALDIVEALRRALTPETVMVVDGGNIGQWFHQTLGREQYPGHWLTCGASGVVGFGIPAAMAARAGCPRRPVVLLSGDGSATFTIADLERAARQDLPFVMIIADDERWGIVETGQVERYGEALSSELGPIDFAELARSLGAVGTRVETRQELDAAIGRGLRERLPAVIHVPIVGGMPAA